MQPDHKVLSESEWYKAHQAVAAWKSAPEVEAHCPRCDTAGLHIIDQSARPYSEWYELNCDACDLVVTMHLPLAKSPGAPI